MIDGISLTSQKFERNLIHLTQEPEKFFLDSLLFAAEDFFKANIVNLEEEEGESNKLDEVHGEVTTHNVVASGSPERSLDISERNKNLVYTCIQTELDFVANQMKENKIVITRMTRNSVRPNCQEE
jgi:hypothetical protein